LCGQTTRRKCTALSALFSDKEGAEEQRQANGHSCHVVVVVTASVNAPLCCGGNVSGQDKRGGGGGGGGGGILDGSQVKRTQSSVSERCSGQRPAGRLVESEWAVYHLLIVWVIV